MSTMFIRERKPECRRDDGVFITDAWFRRFGDDTASVWKDHRGRYYVTTYAQLGERKRARQSEILDRKRAAHTEIRPLYVWVFHCPGVGGVAYRGWWTYFIGRGISEGKYLRGSPLLDQVRSFFPCGDGDLFSLEHDEWMPLFAKRYCVRHADGTPRKHARRIQGKAFVWAEVNGNRVVRLISPAAKATETKKGVVH